MTIETALILAIQNRKIVEFNDGGGYRRIGEPHLLGVCAETGSCQLEIYQTDGEASERGCRLPQWRRFTVDDLWNLQTSAVAFIPRNDFDARSVRWMRVIASVL